MFTAALFAMAKIWNQPKCYLRDEWVKKCNGILSNLKKLLFSLTISKKKRIL